LIVETVTGCLQAILRDLLHTVREMSEYECKADLVTSSVTQFHVLAINQCTLSHESQSIIAVRLLRH